MLEKLNRTFLVRWFRTNRDSYLNKITHKEEVNLYRKVLKKASKDQYEMSIRAKQLQN